MHSSTSHVLVWDITQVCGGKYASSVHIPCLHRPTLSGANYIIAILHKIYNKYIAPVQKEEEISVRSPHCSAAKSILIP